MNESKLTLDDVKEICKRIQDILHIKSKKIKRKSLSGIINHLEKNLNKTPNIEYKKANINLHAKGIYENFTYEIGMTTINNPMDKKNKLNWFIIQTGLYDLMKKYNNSSLDDRIIIFTTICNEVYKCKVHNIFKKDFSLESITNLFSVNERRIVKLILNYIEYLDTHQRGTFQKPNPDFEIAEHEFILKFKKMYSEFPLTVVCLYILVYEFSLYVNQINYQKEDSGDLHINLDSTEEQVFINTIVELFNQLDNQWINFFLNEEYRRFLNISLPCIKFSSTADFIQTRLPDDAEKTINRLRTYLRKKMIGVEEKLDDIFIDKLYALSYSLKDFFIKQNEIWYADLYEGYKSQKLLIPAEFYSPYASYVLSTTITNILIKQKELTAKNIIIENKNIQLNNLITQKNKVVARFSHRYDQMKYDSLKGIINDLAGKNDVFLQDILRKISLEHFIKKNTVLDIRLLNLLMKENKTTYRERIQEGISEYEKEGYVSIEVLLQECIYLVLIRFLYQGKNDFFENIDSPDKRGYKNIKAVHEDMDRFTLLFENNIVENNSNIIEVLNNLGFNINISSKWVMIFFDNDSYVSAFLSDILIELFTNIIKYGNLSEKIEIIFDYDYHENIEYYRIHFFNFYNNTRKGSRQGIKSLCLNLDMFNDIPGVYTSNSKNGIWDIQFYIQRNLFCNIGAV